MKPLSVCVCVPALPAFSLSLWLCIAISAALPDRPHSMYSNLKSRKLHTPVICRLCPVFNVLPACLPMKIENTCTSKPIHNMIYALVNPQHPLTTHPHTHTRI